MKVFWDQVETFKVIRWKTFALVVYVVVLQGCVEMYSVWYAKEKKYIRMSKAAHTRS